MPKVQHTATRVSGDGKQDWGTPREFLDAVERQFQARMDFDLAATAANTVVKRKFFTAEDDALTKPWKGIGKNLWLNPPFSDGKVFAKKVLGRGRALEPRPENLPAFARIY